MHACFVCVQDDDDNELNTWLRAANERVLLSQALTVIRAHIRLLTLKYEKNTKGVTKDTTETVGTERH